MADIKQYTDQIANAVYGEEVRGLIINTLNKVSDDNNSYAQIEHDVDIMKAKYEDCIDKLIGEEILAID